jgi:hypothetical protein
MNWDPLLFDYADLDNMHPHPFTTVCKSRKEVKVGRAEVRTRKATIGFCVSRVDDL